jgi:poly-gamma-glutamate capsule biosynthesis protein CapA/YwtB (metallophosphatase superfamily)
MPELTIFLAGDVMTGRGIDQVLEHPVEPVLYERFSRSALDYVALADEASGPIPRGVVPAYVWGDALAALSDRDVDTRIINLETAITAGGRPWPGKGIHYRMGPGNAPVISAASIDCCVLANNHVLDWSEEGLRDTLHAVQGQGAAPVGAGLDERSAAAPVLLGAGKGPNVLVLAVASESSGVDGSWAAGPGRPGVTMTDLSSSDVARIASRVDRVRRRDTLVVLSVHWGGNWGYEIPARHRRFAHALIDEAGVDIVHGHSSHHALGVEVYRQRLILYGCGDLINDYEGIRGHEMYRPDLTLLYIVTAEPGVGVRNVEMIPMRMRRFRLETCDLEARGWLRERLSREGERFGTRMETSGESLLLRW